MTLQEYLAERGWSYTDQLPVKARQVPLELLANDTNPSIVYAKHIAIAGSDAGTSPVRFFLFGPVEAPTDEYLTVGTYVFTRPRTLSVKDPLSSKTILLALGMVGIVGIVLYVTTAGKFKG
jgi:hypothetical protein